jgi:hypothetical protein
MSFGDRLDNILEPRAQLRTLISSYYDPAKGFAGVTFDGIGRRSTGEDSPDTQHRFTSDDLLAVTLLDVRWSPPAVRELLEDPDGAFGAALHAVPTDDIWSPSITDSHFAAADHLYRLLCELPGVARTRATKVMARKRPRFIPIVDEVIKTALGLPDQWQFQWWHEELVSADRRDALESLRPDGVDVSLLRLLDVVIWMRFSNSESVRAERSSAGLA